MGGGASSPSDGNTNDFEQRESPPVAEPSTSTSESDTDTNSTTETSTENVTGVAAGMNETKTDKIWSSKRTWRDTVTKNDKIEFKQISDVFEASEANTPTDVPTAKEFSRQVFANGVQARHIEMGYDGFTAHSLDPDAKTIGGWKTFDVSNIKTRESIKDAVETTGRTDDFMEEVTLKPDLSTAASKAYSTDYGHGSSARNTPNRDNAHSQMAVSAALDSMGVDVPNHAFDTESKTVYVESVARTNYETQVLGEGNGDGTPSISSDLADKIDADQMRDMMAANIIAGNVDLKSDNLMIGEDGRVLTFDFDFTDTYGTLASAESRSQGWVNDSLQAVDKAKTDGFELTSEEVFDRVEEIATQLDSSGRVDKVIETTEKYDEFFQQENREEYGGVSDTYVDPVSERINKHVTNWSNANNDTVL